MVTLDQALLLDVDHVCVQVVQKVVSSMETHVNLIPAQTQYSATVVQDMLVTAVIVVMRITLETLLFLGEPAHSVYVITTLIPMFLGAATLPLENVSDVCITQKVSTVSSAGQATMVMLPDKIAKNVYAIFWELIGMQVLVIRSLDSVHVCPT